MKFYVSDFTIHFALPNTNNAQCFQSIPQIIIVGHIYICVLFFFQSGNNIDLKHTCKKREIPEIYLRNFFWIFRKILG